MKQDRNYYRMMTDRDLTLIASERFTTDLELVVLERLDQARDLSEQLEAAQAEIEGLTEDRDYWMLKALKNAALREDAAKLDKDDQC